MRIILKIVIGVSLLLFITGCNYKQVKKDNVTIKGRLEGFDNATDVEDFSEFQYLLPPSPERIIVPDEKGNFNISFKITSPNYYRLGRNVLYLTPGDTTTVFINYENAQYAIFSGSGATVNTYLKGTPFPHMGSYLGGAYDVEGNIENKIDTIEELANKRKKELASIANIPVAFKTLEMARIKADVINSLEYLSWPAKADSNKIINDKKYVQSKIDKLSKGFVNPSYMKLAVYREIAGDLIKHNKGESLDRAQSIKDWYVVSDLVDSMSKVNDKNKLLLLKNEIGEIKTTAYRQAGEKAISKLLFFGQGDDAVDITAVDTNGKRVKLSDLKGKVIYVDIWATWCIPCMNEMPMLKKLKEQYKKNPNIAFISLSIDNDEAAWKSSVRNNSFNGYQWRVNRTALQAYNVASIPRMLLIDKNFKISNLNAPLPSDKSLPLVIDKLTR